MFDARIWPLIAVKKAIEYISADKRTRKMLKYCPEACLRCELLGICRDERRDWKCKAGCLALRDHRIPGPVRGGESGAREKGAPGRTK